MIIHVFGKEEYMSYAVKLIRFLTALTLTAILMGLLTSSGFAANYTYSYFILDRSGGYSRYQLTVSVTSSLHDYYVGKDHSVASIDDLGKFVTPYALKPIADDLRRIYSDDEDFANGVLMIVHQIPYEAVKPEKYPVETIVENKGDCDLFSFIAASVMIAGGLNVVLLYYEVEDHMNVGINLSNTPHDVRSGVTYFSSNGQRYYMAETTGDNWENGWRVGECPDQLKVASVHIITLQNAERSSPEQVSSSFNAISSMTLSLSSTLVLEGNAVTISGSISSVNSSEPITIHVKLENSSWSVLKTVLSDSNGHYSYAWTPASAGTYLVRSSWAGDTDQGTTESNTQTLRIIPLSWIFIPTISITLVIIAVIILNALRRSTMPQ